MFTLLMTQLALPPADAFCGTYVGGVGSEFYNTYSQLAVVRENNQTTLTIVNDVEGNFDGFALVIPVPEVIPEDKVNVLEPELFDRLDAYSQPRLVSYVCEDFEERWDTGAAPNSDDFADGGGDGGVNVEDLYIVGEFEITILSATESGSLFTWLNNNGYQIPGQSQDLLQDYIDGGSYFLAAKVAPDADISSGDKLSPLQFAYDSDAFQIPIRIGTLNAKEAQDLVVYTVSEYQNGRVGIANSVYKEFSVEDECMWDSVDDQSFGEYYAEQFTDAYEETESGAWTVEYAWGGGGCDPCSGTPPDGSDLVALGLNEDLVHTSDYFFTRLHARYTPAQATEELMLYQSNITDQEQYRFIEYKYELEDRFPICGIGMADDPGSCENTNEPSNESTDTGENNTNTEQGCGGCSSGSSDGGMILGVSLMGLLGLTRRRSR
jgi:MYXO-CTERM domain-containing protein